MQRPVKRAQVNEAKRARAIASNDLLESADS